MLNTKSSPNKANHIVEMYGLQVNGHTPPSFLNILPIMNPINAPIVGPKISFNTIVKNYPSLFPKWWSKLNNPPIDFSHTCNF